MLSFLNGEDTPGDVVVVLHEPRLDENVLTYTVDVLEGALPASAGPCAPSSIVRTAVVAGLGPDERSGQRGHEPAIRPQPAVS